MKMVAVVVYNFVVGTVFATAGLLFVGRVMIPDTRETLSEKGLVPWLLLIFGWIGAIMLTGGGLGLIVVGFLFLAGKLSV